MCPVLAYHFTQCGTITGDSFVGGVIGANADGVVVNCVAQCKKISGTGNDGFIGSVTGINGVVDSTANCGWLSGPDVPAWGVGGDGGAQSTVVSYDAAEADGIVVAFTADPDALKVDGSAVVMRSWPGAKSEVKAAVTAESGNTAIATASADAATGHVTAHAVAKGAAVITANGGALKVTDFATKKLSDAKTLTLGAAVNTDNNDAVTVPALAAAVTVEKAGPTPGGGSGGGCAAGLGALAPITLRRKKK